jgi:hypothetical protein
MNLQGRPGDQGADSSAIRLPKTFVLAVLALVYILAFIVSPYWMMARSPVEMILILIVTISLGAVWCYLSAGELRVHSRGGGLLPFAGLLLGMAALNYRPFISVIPWRGDESVHIAKILYLTSRIPVNWILCIFFLFGLILYAAWRGSGWAMVPGTLLVVGVVIFYWRNDVLDAANESWILRYPLIDYWLYMLVPKLAGAVFGPYHEILYRIFPAVSMFVLAWIFQSELARSQGPADLLWGFSVATVPIVFYYSSVLYLEPLALFLMLIVCLRIKDLVRDDHDRLGKNPAWYALILIGFIKETTIVFLVCFLICRFIFRLWSRKRPGTFEKQPEDGPGVKSTGPLRRFFAGEMAVFFSVFFPYLLYIFLRSTLTTNRSFHPYLPSLMDFSVYRAIGQSFLEQFGPFLILFVAGCLLLALRREYSTLCFLLLLFLVIPAFHAADNRGYFAGYSRFNLFVLPAVLAGAQVVLREVVRQRRMLGSVAAGAIILVNLLISPVNPDGTKAPFWGNYLFDTSEHYYPYKEALLWLKETGGDERILFTGMDYTYFLDFYFDGLDWHPRHQVEQVLVSASPDDKFGLYFDPLDWHPQRKINRLLMTGGGESDNLSKMLVFAGDNDFDVVVYQVLGTDIPRARETGDFHLEKVFRNEAHVLLVYSKAP